MYRATIAISSFLFLLGVAFPVAAKFYNPFLAYGIVFISWPAFGIGAICGGMVGFFSKRDIPSNSTFFLLGWGMFTVNIMAAITTIFIPFYAS